LDSSLSDLLCYLISGKGNNFYARIVAALELDAGTAFPMMAVTVRKRHYVLFYNPEWFAGASYEEILFALEHEILHCILEHIPRHLEQRSLALSDEDKEDIRILSPFAADMAVNSLLLGKNAFLDAHREDYIVPGNKNWDYPAGKAYEVYLKLLRKKYPHKKLMESMLRQYLLVSFAGEGNTASMFKDGNGNGNGKNGNGKPKDKKGEGGQVEGEDGRTPGQKQLANHRDWSADSKQDPVNTEDLLSLADELTNRFKGIVAKAVEDQRKGRGTLPAGLEEALDKWLKEPEIPWVHIVRTMVVTTQKYRTRRSAVRMKRRTIGVPDFCSFPGQRKERKFRIGWLIDTSGSMGSAELEQGLNELRGIQKIDKDVEVVVIEADAAVEHEYELNSPSKRINYDVHGRGGTSFDPALLRAQKLKLDVCFYFTDGYAPAPEVGSHIKCPFAWVITPNGQIPDKGWGHVIQTHHQQPRR
jgi:predicted metal-dependent peptidase